MCQCFISFYNYHLTGHFTPNTFPHPHSVFTTAVRHTLSPPPALQSADNRESLHKEIFRIYSPTSLSSLLTMCCSTPNTEEQEEQEELMSSFCTSCYTRLYLICGRVCTATVQCTVHHLDMGRCSSEALSLHYCHNYNAHHLPHLSNQDLK